MPTNDERRKVAERLRLTSLEAVVVEGEIEIPFRSVEYALGLDSEDWGSYSHDDVMHLADLIEPEGRTCRDTWDGREFRCSACGVMSHVLERDEAGDWQFVGAPRFCPHCGAEVIPDA